MGSSGRDILRAVGRVTETHGEAPNTTARTGWAAGGVLGGLGLGGLAAGLYYASQRAAEKGDSHERAVKVTHTAGSHEPAEPAAVQVAHTAGADSHEPAEPAAEPEAYFAIPDGKQEILPVSDTQQQQCIASLLSDEKLNAAGELTRASDGARQLRGVFRWRGDESVDHIADSAFESREHHRPHRRRIHHTR